MSSQISDPKLSKATVQHGEKIAMARVIPVGELKWLSLFERPHPQLVVVQEILMLAWIQATRLDLAPLVLEQQRLLKEIQTPLRLLMISV